MNKASININMQVFIYYISHGSPEPIGESPTGYKEGSHDYGG